MKKYLAVFLLLVTVGAFAQKQSYVYRFQLENRDDLLSASLIDSTISILKKRLSNSGYSSSNVTYDQDKGQFIVERNNELDDEFIGKWLIKPCELFFYETYTPVELYEALLTGDNSEKARNDKVRLLELLHFPIEIQSGRMQANIGILKTTDAAEFNEIRKRLDPYFPSDCKLIYSSKVATSAQNPPVITAEVFAIRNNEWKMTVNSTVKSAKGVMSDGKHPAISVELTEMGKKKFAKITEKNVGKPIAIVIDGRVFSAPFVYSMIEGGKMEIAGNFSKEEADQFAKMLTAGHLIVKLILVR